jgi:selenocysteine lyase/cysteine desulfurase
MDITEIRKLFPHLEKGIIYFNHASASPLSLRVQEEIKKYIYNQSVYRIDDIIVMIRESSKAKKLFASLINSKSDRVAYTDNTSNGLNILARGIKWKKETEFC